LIKTIIPAFLHDRQLSFSIAALILSITARSRLGEEAPAVEREEIDHTFFCTIWRRVPEGLIVFAIAMPRGLLILVLVEIEAAPEEDAGAVPLLLFMMILTNCFVPC
jgi:hypothetical protein